MPARISIVIPTFDRPAKLKRALDSCLNQTVPAYEIIVVDNGENPETKPTVKAASKDTGTLSIHYMPSEPFQLRKALANGIDAATGDWIILLDDDDFLVTDRILNDQQLLSEIKPDVILLVQDFLRVDYEHALIWEHRMQHKPLGLYEALVLDNFPPPPAGTWRADALKARHSFDQPDGWTDFDLYASALPYGKLEKSGNLGYVMDDTRTAGRLTTNADQTLKMVRLHRERFRENRKFTDIPNERIDARLDQQEAFFLGKMLGFRSFLRADQASCRTHPKEALKGILAPFRAHLSRVFADQMPEMRGSKTYSLKRYSKDYPDLSAYIKAQRITTK